MGFILLITVDHYWALDCDACTAPVTAVVVLRGDRLAARGRRGCGSLRERRERLPHGARAGRPGLTAPGLARQPGRGARAELPARAL